MKERRLAFFIPHKGCKQSCIFCNQRAISGKINEVCPNEVFDKCNLFLPEPGNEKGMEIAFFGGSFTAIDKGYMTQLLEAANHFIIQRRASGIRISTRPDSIDEDILETLKKYSVKAIELGAQSSDDSILLANERGHDHLSTTKASNLIRDFEFSLGLQMMVGMYGDKDPKMTAIKTAEDFAFLRPQTMRIYPTLVLKGTKLEDLFNSGKYVPLSVKEAIDCTVEALSVFDKADIETIRIGLHSEMSLHKSFLAGPYHPAFGEKVNSRIIRNKVMNLLENERIKTVKVAVGKGMKSAAIGQKRENIVFFNSLGIRLIIEEDEKLGKREVKILNTIDKEN